MERGCLYKPTFNQRGWVLFRKGVHVGRTKNEKLVRNLLHNAVFPQTSFHVMPCSLKVNGYAPMLPNPLGVPLPAMALLCLLWLVIDDAATFLVNSSIQEHSSRTLFPPFPFNSLVTSRSERSVTLRKDLAQFAKLHFSSKT